MFKLLCLIKKVLDRIIAGICIVIVGAMTMLISYQVVSRYLFNSPSAISEVLSRYLFVWLILLAGAYVFGLREHMHIAFLKNKLPPTLRTIADVIAEIAIAVFAIGVMMIGGYRAAVKQMFQLDSALQIPIGIIYAAIPISGAIMLFYAVFNVIKFYRQTDNQLS